MPPPCLHPLRVYYEDTDFSGLVYHASYLRFMERGRTEFLRAHAVVQSDLYREADGLAFVVSRMVLDYIKPARMDDQLIVATSLKHLRGASMILTQEILNGGLCLTRAEVTVAAVRQGRAVRLPAALRNALMPSPIQDSPQ